MFRRIFSGQLTNFKPRSMHTAASSYYLVAKGYQPEVLDSLQVGKQSCVRGSGKQYIYNTIVYAYKYAFFNNPSKKGKVWNRTLPVT